MVKVKKEPPGLGAWMENCVICGQGTRYWYLPYNQPLCQECAKVSFVKDIPKNPYFPSKK